MPESADHLAPDAPLRHILSIHHNPLVAAMPKDQLTALVRKLRQHATAPTHKPKQKKVAVNARQAKLEAL